MEDRYWHWITKGIDGICDMLQQQVTDNVLLPQSCLDQLTCAHKRLTQVINRQREKRARAPLPEEGGQ